ncbi:partial Methyl-accepting chemotaxis protein McpB, partial [Burkholderiaceae bacterium]
MNLNNLKIGTRLGLGFGLLLALMLLVVAISFARLMQTQQGMDAAAGYQRRAALAEQWVSKSLLNANRTIAVAKAAGLPDVEAYYAPLIKQTADEIAVIQKDLETQVTDAKGKTLLASIEAKRKTYTDARNAMYEFFKSADQPAVESLVKEKLLPAVDAYGAALNELQRHEDAQAAERSAEVNADMKLAKTTLIVLLVIGLAVGATGAVAITRSVTRPLQEAVDAARIIANNDLSHTLESRRKDELGDLLRA